jgi:mono/diheme cytochrome c family protein
MIKKLLAMLFRMVLAAFLTSCFPWNWYDDTDDQGEELNGQEPYSKNCQSCHGADGTQHGNFSNMTVDELMHLLPHFNVTSK